MKEFALPAMHGNRGQQLTGGDGRNAGGKTVILVVENRTTTPHA